MKLKFVWLEYRRKSPHSQWILMPVVVPVPEGRLEEYLEALHEEFADTEWRRAEIQPSSVSLSGFLNWQGFREETH
jgi:hypothetical protein